MKKPSSKIRDQIAKLQEELKIAETREAERIGRVALKAGLGEIDIEEADLLAAFEDLAARFRGESRKAQSGKKPERSAGSQTPGSAFQSGETSGKAGEA